MSVLYFACFCKLRIFFVRLFPVLVLFFLSYWKHAYSSTSSLIPFNYYIILETPQLSPPSCGNLCSTNSPCVTHWATSVVAQREGSAGRLLTEATSISEG